MPISRINAVQNIGRMFVLCSRFLDDLQGIRHCLFDLFYFKSPRNHLLLGIVMALWPDSLPAASDPLATTPLMETLVWCVFNTGPSQKAPEMKVREVQDDFVRNYGYKQNLWKADDLVKRFIAVAESDPSEAELREVTTARCTCQVILFANNFVNLSNHHILPLQTFGTTQC